MRRTLQKLDEQFVFQTSGRFDLLAGDHVAYSIFGASDADGALRRSIERAEGVTTVVGRMGSGKSSIIAAVVTGLDEGFLPLRISVIGVEAGDPAAFARHAITEICELPDTQLSRHEVVALDRAKAEHKTQRATRELRAGFEIAAGAILNAKVVGDIKRAASEELKRSADPSDAFRGIQRLLDTFWRIKRCPVLIVEDTDHWGGSPQIADAFFDQTARAFANLDAAMVVATQNDYTRLEGYRRIRDRLTGEVLLPRLPNVGEGLRTLIERRMSSAGIDVALNDVLETQGLELLCDCYLESVVGSDAGDLRRTLAVMRAAVDIALADATAQRVTRGHVDEAIARTPLALPSAL
jgi:hypothetical protein